jgi:arylsulfatase A-like enzyme
MSRPNIVLILIDDLGWRDLSCFGSAFYETPNLDALAARGTIFSDAYASCPVCSPTRASILTGKYPARLGITDWIDWSGRLHPCRGRLIDAPYVRQLPLTEYSLAAALRDAGYATWHVGKWHLGADPCTPRNHGFEVNIGGCHWGCPHRGYFSPWDIPGLENGPRGQYLTDFLTDQAIQLIRSNDGRPFFLNLWHYAVHTPIQAPADLVERFAAKARDMGLDRMQAFEEGYFFPCEHKKNQKIRRRLVQSDPAYAAMIFNLDQNIGRLIASLEETGAIENTVIIFTSDNGGLATAEGSPTSNLPLSEGKGWMYEGGIRVPLIVNWPGVSRPASVCRAPVTSPDLYPTILEMAQASVSSAGDIDGVSLAPLFRGSEKLDRTAIFWHYPHYGNQGGTPSCGVRSGNYKLIRFFEEDYVELYNLESDIREARDISADYPGAASRLNRMLDDWLAAVSAVMPSPNPDYRPW